MDAFNKEVKITKTNDEQQLIFGWANITKSNGKLVADADDDVIKSENLEKAAYDYVLKSRNAGEMHLVTEGVGQIVETFFCNVEKCQSMGMEYPGFDGWWIGFKLNQEAYEKVKKGQYRSLSIGGKATRKEVKEDE